MTKRRPEIVVSLVTVIPGIVPMGAKMAALRSPPPSSPDLFRGPVVARYCSGPGNKSGDDGREKPRPPINYRYFSAHGIKPEYDGAGWLAQ